MCNQKYNKTLQGPGGNKMVQLSLGMTFSSILFCSVLFFGGTGKESLS